MKTSALLFLLTVSLCAQTAVYVRAGGPQQQIVSGATSTSPIMISTVSPHGFSSSCNTTANVCYCAVEGVTMGTGVNHANGVRECVYVDSTHLSLYDTSGTAVNGTGDGAWWNGTTLYPNIVGVAQWVSPLTKYTIPANSGPLGFLDGTNGDLTRRVSLGPENGMAVSSGLYTTGCPSACVIHVATTYDPTASTNRFPVAAGQHFSVTGTGTNLDTCGDGSYASGAQSPYTMASVSSAGWVSNSFTCAGLAGGTVDYTNVNPHCGPAATPNDTIGGTQSCSHVSQMAYRGSPIWEIILTKTSWFTSGTSYKTTFDGGSATPGNDLFAQYAMAADRFLVDPTNSQWLSVMLYALNNDFRTGGVGYAVNHSALAAFPNWDYNFTVDTQGMALMYAAVAHSALGNYWASPEQSAFLNRMYNDVDDPTLTACTTTNQDAANQANHLWVLSTGNLAVGTNDSSHAQLPSSDPHYSTINYYQNTIIMLSNGGANAYTHATYGLITAQNNAGVLTVSAWTNSAVTPVLNNVVSGTYTGGLTCTGSTGQTVGMSVAGGGGNAQVYATITAGGSPATVGSALSVVIPGSGYSTGSATAYPVNYMGSANCTGTATLSITAGTAYTILDTITTNSTTPGEPATISFTKTSSLSGSINAGDGIIGYNGWLNETPLSQSMSYVSAVGSNTLSVINGSSVTASPTPQVAWRIPQWIAGDCGRNWVSRSNASNAFGGITTLYGPGVGGDGSNLSTSNYIVDSAYNGGGAVPTAWMVFDLVAAPDDSRAVRELARTQSYMFDNAWRPIEDYTGRGREGPGYSLDGEIPFIEEFLWPLTQTLSGYPTLHVTSPWAQNTAAFVMFAAAPDYEGNSAWMMGFGGVGYLEYPFGPYGLINYSLGLNPTAWWAPQSNLAGWFRNWQEKITPPHDGTASLWGSTEPDMLALSFLHNDPRIADIDYTQQPHQIATTQTGGSFLPSDTGWPHWFSGQEVISRTGWTSQNDTQVQFDSGAFTGNGTVYDSPRVGQVSIWATGCLNGADSNPCNANWNGDPSVWSDTFQFGGQQPSRFQEFKSGTPPDVGDTPLTCWASANAGAYGAQYGDSQSRYVIACTETKANYNTANLGISIDHAQRSLVHFKKPGFDQFIFTYDDDALTSGTTQMAFHLHFPQNGTTQAGGSGNMGAGTTTCPGAGGCTSINTNGRTIQTVEDGFGTPARTHGLMVYVTSPNTITVRADCAGMTGGHCSPGNTYSGGNGYTDRFTIAGGSSVGSNVSSFSAATVRKVMSTLSDTTLTTTDLNPDANWTGVQAVGANSTAVALFARNGVTHSTITPFSLIATGPLQLALVGLTPGNYTLSVGGAQVFSGAVGAGDTTLYAEATGGGAIFLTSGTTGPTTSSILSGQVTVSGNAVIH